MVFKKILIPTIFNLLLLLILLQWLDLQHRNLENPQYILGWTLLGLTVFMSFYSLRKKLSTLPLGSNSTWYLLHLIIGVWCFILFGLHTRWTIPENLINFALWLGYITILISGIVGYLLNKFLAPVVSSHGERLIFNRIPQFINRNREEATKVIQEAASSEFGKPLFDYYTKGLKDVFYHNGHLWHRIIGHKRRLQRILIQLEDIERYLDAENTQRMIQLKELVKQKFLLSWQYSTLSILRNWTVLHVPIIWFTMIVLMVHIISQYAFQLRTPW
jgi:hypothetical protein